MRIAHVLNFYDSLRNVLFLNHFVHVLMYTRHYNTYVTLDQKTVLSSTSIFAIAENKLYGSKLSIYFMQKIIMILSKVNVP